MIIIWRAETWAGLRKMKGMLLGGKEWGRTLTGVRLTSKFVFQAKKTKASSVRSFFLVWLLEKESQECHMGTWIRDSTFHISLKSKDRGLRVMIPGWPDLSFSLYHQLPPPLLKHWFSPWETNTWFGTHRLDSRKGKKTKELLVLSLLDPS